VIDVINDDDFDDDFPSSLFLFAQHIVVAIPVNVPGIRKQIILPLHTKDEECAYILMVVQPREKPDPACFEQ